MIVWIEGEALRRERGFTLLELMVAIAILSIIAALAIPSASEYIDSRKVINAAEAVYGQLQLARSQSIARSARVYSSFGYSDNNDAKTWVMAISTVKDCDLAGTLTVLNGTTPSLPDAADDCILVVDDGDGTVHGVNGGSDVDDLTYPAITGATFSGVELDADGNRATAGAPGTVTFDPVRGTATNRTVYLTYMRGDGSIYEARVVSYLTGRVRICSPAGANKVPGYTAC